MHIIELTAFVVYFLCLPFCVFTGLWLLHTQRAESSACACTKWRLRAAAFWAAFVTATFASRFFPWDLPFGLLFRCALPAVAFAIPMTLFLAGWDKVIFQEQTLEDFSRSRKKHL